MSNSKDVIAGPEYTRLQKISNFFFTLQSSLCKKSRLNHVGSLKIDKRDKLPKVTILSDAEWLFWSDTKKRHAAEIKSYFIRNQTTKQSEDGIIPLA